MRRPKARPSITALEKRIINESGRAALTTTTPGLDWHYRAERIARIAELRPKPKGSP